jgi:outer membrane lipoprotein-sorting protein
MSQRLTRRLMLGLVLFAPAAWAAPAPAPASADDLALVEKARDYLRGLTNAIGRFVQTDPKGRTSSGMVYLKRPGRARFDYDPPSGLTVAANGFRVAVVNKRLNTINAYPLGLTPLGVLLSRDIRIDKSVAIGQVVRRPGGFSISATRTGKKTEGRISLDFKTAPLVLEGWSITDPEGGVTRVRLEDFGPGKAMPNSFFEVGGHTAAAKAN